MLIDSDRKMGQVMLLVLIFLLALHPAGTTNVLRVCSAAGPDYWFNENGDGQLKLYDSETAI